MDKVLPLNFSLKAGDVVIPLTEEQFLAVSDCFNPSLWYKPIRELIALKHRVVTEYQIIMSNH